MTATSDGAMPLAAPASGLASAQGTTPSPVPAATLRTELRPLILAGALVIAVAFGGFGGWAAIAPLASAAIAVGKVVVEGNRKSVQHLEGGIIREVLVKEGDRVEAGQTLLRLDDTAPKSEQQSVDGQIIALLAAEARLAAERDGRDTLVFDPELIARAGEPEIAAAMEAQRTLFATRAQAYRGRVEILTQRIGQSEEVIRGLESQVRGQERQLRLIREEVAGLRGLFERGNVTKQRMLALEREGAAIEGRRGELLADISRTQQKIGEDRLIITDLTNQRAKEAADELTRNRVNIAALTERREAARAVLGRIEVRAPHAGRVVGLTVNTVGQVIAPGEALMDIVPQDQGLVVEARLRPLDIDVVHAGLKAEVRLTAYSSRKVPTIPAVVRDLSADLFVDERSGDGYYRALVDLDPQALANIAEVSLYPGMPVEVMIVTGERTALEYLAQPIIASFNRSLREE